MGPKGPHGEKRASHADSKKQLNTNSGGRTPPPGLNRSTRHDLPSYSRTSRAKSKNRFREREWLHASSRPRPLIQPCPVRDEYGPAGQAVFCAPEAAPRPTQRMHLLRPLCPATMCTARERRADQKRIGFCKFAVSFGVLGTCEPQACLAFRRSLSEVFCVR